MKEEHYILFDEYLQGELSAADKESFERQLTEDPELASAFEAFKEINQQLENKFSLENERNAFKENVSAISEKHFQPEKTKVVSFKPWRYLIAASVAILFGLFFLLQSSNPEFEDYNHYETAYFTERGEENQAIQLAQEAFNNKNYKEAIVQFEVVLKKKSNPEIEYFYGISLLEENKFNEAETIFNKLNSDTSVFKNKAIWSLALLKLKQKDYASCKKLLHGIPSDYEDYDEVQELLNDLD
jgi:thioredoxin-like negative regulator of GroEL